MTQEGAVAMAFIVVCFLCGVCLFLVLAGAVEIDRRAERWERYEQWMHPPDDDDGISLLEEDHHADD